MRSPNGISSSTGKMALWHRPLKTVVLQYREFILYLQPVEMPQRIQFKLYSMYCHRHDDMTMICQQCRDTDGISSLQSHCKTRGSIDDGLQSVKFAARPEGEDDVTIVQFGRDETGYQHHQWQQICWRMLKYVLWSCVMCDLLTLLYLASPLVRMSPVKMTSSAQAAKVGPL